MKTLYETDFHKWIEEQSAFLKNREFQKLDVEHLLEEMEDMGITEKRIVQSHLLNLLIHLIKQNVQPERAGKSWGDSITAARAQIKLYTDESKILKKHLEEVYLKTYQKAREAASKEMKMESRAISSSCPWSIKEALGD